MFSFQNLLDKKTLAAFIVSCVSFVWSIVSLFLMTSSLAYISYDGNYFVRYILVYVVNAIFALGSLRFALGCLQTKHQNGVMWQGFVLLILGLCCVIGIAVLTLLEDYSISMRLLEDAMYALVALIAIFICIFGLTIKDKKKLFIISMILAGLFVFAAIFDFSVFALSDFSVAGVDETKTLRDVDFQYVFSSIGLLVPFVTAGLYSIACFVNPDPEEEITEE